MSDPVLAVLPPHVIDQIAAGEVIERPSSVVKELVDNAIDAGARMIQIETQMGGRALLRITDDGSGMSRSDTILALERHATSKIRCVEDLWGLTSMGFRGEALPAIASVSRMTLVTRRECDLAATRVLIEGGRIVTVDEIGAPVGTTIAVVDLLYNIPARLKFLKGEGTEASHITELVAKVAMAHPQLHVRLRHNGRVALDAPPDRDGFARACALLGTKVASRLVVAHGEESGVRVTAYLGAPELAQTTARGVQLFVGKRPIRDRGLLHALAMGYGELVPRGRYPVAIVHIDVPAGAVDYNVHPQKLEVRFADAGIVCATVRHVVQAGIASAPWRTEIGAGPVMMTAIASVVAPRLPFDGQVDAPSGLANRYATQLRERRDGTQGRFGFDVSSAVAPRTWAQRIKDQVRASRAAEASSLQAIVDEPAAAAIARQMSSLEVARGLAKGSVGGGTVREFAKGSGVGFGGVAMPADRPAEFAQGSGPVAARGFFASLRFLGQIDLTYLACDGDGELVLVDQHSAHERVELARLRGRTDRDVAIQKMLFPVTIEATAAQLALVGRAKEILAQVGFEAEPFGKTTIAIKAVPAGIRHGDPTQLLRRLLAEWAAEGAPSEAELVERMLSEIACHSVVRAGDRLTAGEAEALLRSLDDVDHAGHGPHGRPVLLRLPLTEIARQFGR